MPVVLTLNAGSSSIRFALYGADDLATKLLDGKIDRIGLPGTVLHDYGTRQGARREQTIDVPASDRRSAVVFLLEWLTAQPLFSSVIAVGHRVVHGMDHALPERITPALIAELQRLTAYDPEHLPREIELMEAVARARPELPQIACFDTAFHRTMPRVATMLPLPRRYERKGVRRYGFHGLSYTYLMAQLGRVGDRAASRGRVILAHLGNGASLAAVRDGRSIDTSMGFTPTAGLVMSTRSGDLDPGVVSFLANTEGMDAAAFQRMVSLESGLLGVSETSSDLRDLMARAAEDVRAAEAVDLFCYQARKWIGAFAAALGGLDTLVFAGGIGENASEIRARICEGLKFLGVDLDAARNGENAPVISAASAGVVVRVIRTDEESVIAAATLALFNSITTKDA